MQAQTVEENSLNNGASPSVWRHKNGPLSSSLPNIVHVHWEVNENTPKSRRNTPFIIGVAGGTASGKTSVCELIHKQLNNQRIVIISQDSFYRPLSQSDLARVHEYNFDHPNAFDFDLLNQVFKDLRDGKPVNIPTYDFKTHSRTKEVTSIYGADVILFEGILAFYNEGLRSLMDMKLFVDTDPDERLSRRIMRDIKERGRDWEGVIHQYRKFVKPAFDEYIFPTKKYADVIIPRGADNLVAINLIVQHIDGKLSEAARAKITKSKDRSVTVQGVEDEEEQFSIDM